MNTHTPSALLSARPFAGLSAGLFAGLSARWSAWPRAALALCLASPWGLGGGLGGALAATPLADQPVFSSSGVPGNLALALSVEYPTAISVAHIDTVYNSANTYLGYFDPAKCYQYQPYAPETATLKSHFYPAGTASSRTCVGANDAMWSGNFLNWSSMQTIDPFRWALTGGYRAIDTPTLTILEKAYASGQGGDGNFPNKIVADSTALAAATPFTGAVYTARVQGLGARMTLVGPAFTGSILGQYFNNTTLTGTPVLTRFDTVDFNWANGAPGAGVNSDLFSARWTSNSVATTAGVYSFRTTSDDGVRLYVNGNLVINNWTLHGPTDDIVNVTLAAGDRLDITLEYFEQTGGAVMRLYAKRPGELLFTPYRPAADSQNTGSVPGLADPQLFMRVKVCDAGAPGGVESNCTAYPAGNYKPTGLMQQYAAKIRYSAFGYLNDTRIERDGGVLRARQKFIGPAVPNPGSVDSANPAPEWDSSNGVMAANPNPADAADTAAAFGVSVSNSGVMNYLNKFGQITPGSYKTYDPVGELYYAALRYYKNLGNVPEWTNMGGATAATKITWVDGFPVITAWDDPVQYACQRNFILGIGDVNTHADKNLPGPTGSANEPAKPGAVVADTGVDAVKATNKVGELHTGGSYTTFGTAENINGCCSNNSALMAGLAYDANTVDIRPETVDKPQTKGMQTVQTLWIDVLEGSTYKANNQYYLAAKYGGFQVPKLFDPYARTTDIPLAWWSTTGDTVGGQARPDNYYTGGRPDQMVAGLGKAFSSIADQLKAFTTSFSSALPQVANTDSASYSTQYDAGTWTGELTANGNTFDATTGEPTLVASWTFTSKLAAQIAGTGWDTNRRMVTWNTSTAAGVPLRTANISAAQKLLLDTVYRSGDDSADYLKYLRGDPTQEENSAVIGSSKAYRTRSRPVGDIVGAKARAVGPPSAPFSSAANPGYAAFKTEHAGRTTMVYTGSNAGMLHAVDGTLTGASAGREVFAYVPGALYAGPTGSAQDTGLQSVGDPDFTHHYMVDGPQAVFDIDFGRTPGGSGAADWRSVLVGAMGKGGKAYYAIDVTDPSSINTTSAVTPAIEAGVAAKVLWEFSHPLLGYTYGEPAAVKTRKYGWVLIFGSGYNNSDGKGYFFIVNPRTGALLEPPIGTGAGSLANDAGLAQVQAFVPDRTDNTADAIYAGDLLGNLWRLNVNAASGAYPAPVPLAALTDALGNALPVTSRPLVVVQPGTNRRFVTVGTGRLLANSDVGSTQAQAFYAVIDGNGLAYGTAATLPSGMAYPIRSNNLRKLTDLTQAITLDLTTQIGWWYDLGNGAGNLGWRDITDSTSFFGVVAFTATLPSGDACSPAGTSRVYAIDLGTGQSKLTVGGNTVAYVSTVPGVVSDLRFYSVAGKPRLIAGNDAGGVASLPGNWGGTLGARRLNWRELLLAD